MLFLHSPLSLYITPHYTYTPSYLSAISYLPVPSSRMLVVNTRLGWVAAFRGFPHSKGVMSASKVSHLESHGTLCCKNKHASPRARPETGDYGRARGA